MTGNQVVRYCPQGGETLVPDDFAVEATAVPELGAGQLLVAVEWLSIDPYMFRALMGLEKSMPPIRPGEPMTGRVIGRVLESRDARYAPGSHVLCFSPWQRLAVVPAETAITVDLTKAEPPAYLGALGQSGITAWVGLFKVARLAAGETLVVSAAGGAVGSVAGQLGRRHGCRVVGVAGGADKCRHVVEAFGFDTCIDYRVPDFQDELAHALPNGVDVYFENVGGPVFDLVLGHMNDYGRIVVCGLIAHYERPQILSIANFDRVMAGALRIEAFRAKDFVQFRAEAVVALSEAFAEGALRYDLTMVDGLAEAPRALVNLLHGTTRGKSVVKVA